MQHLQSTIIGRLYLHVLMLVILDSPHDDSLIIEDKILIILLGLEHPTTLVDF